MFYNSCFILFFETKSGKKKVLSQKQKIKTEQLVEETKLKTKIVFLVLIFYVNVEEGILFYSYQEISLVIIDDFDMVGIGA